VTHEVSLKGDFDEFDQGSPNRGNIKENLNDIELL
jgi:hypothetical protein